MKKRLIAFLLVLIMVLGMLPASAFAADGDANMYTYHLIHEFNYVGGTRWDITATTAAESYQLDVNKGKPTRARYKFDGWADEANATTATYFGGEWITLTKDNRTKTIYAIWKPIFELHYNANGGTGAPDSQTYTALSATTTRATFTSRNQIPTKDGYTFKGWADSAAATTAQYQPGGTIAVNHADSPKTVYAVWEKNATPTEYTVTYYKNDGSENDLFYKTKDWGRPAEQYSIYWGKPTRDGYDFVGWAETRNATEAKYASGGAGGKQSWIKLDGPKVLYAVWQEAGREPEAPRDPSDCEDQLKKNTIKLVCVGGNHPDKMITFADISYGSDWSMGDTCKLNFYAKDAALKYPEHAPKNPEERIYVTFKWVNDEKDANGKYLPGKWVMDETTAAVVELVDTGVETPSQPTTAQLGNIKVTCRTDAAHSSEFPVAECMGTTVGTVTFDSVKKQWYIDTAPMTTRLASRYDSWKGYAEGTHRLVNPDAKLNARFYYDGEKWYTEDTLAIDVCCGETPVKPTALDGSFAIVCKNNKATHPHKADYIATPSQYTISDVQMDDQGYYVTATVTVAPNLAAYNTATRVEHRLVNEQDATLTITFRYDPKATGKWTQQGKQQGELPVVEVICKVIEAPTREDIFGALNGLVTVTCINRFWKDGNNNMDCGQGQYAAKAGIAGQDYTLVKGEDAGTWVVTFPVTNFVKSFKQDPAHNLYTKDTLRWYIRWEDNTWTSAPVEPGVDDLVKLTHAPTDWREVAKIATGGKSDCIHTHCVNSGLNVCDYGITVPFVNFNEDVVSVVPEEGVPGSYIATFKVDKFVDARAKVCNDKNFPDAPRTHKRLTQETVRWRLYATSEADEKIGNNVLNHVWEAEPVEAGKDDVCTIAHNWVVTFNPDNGEPAFKQNVEYEGKATEPAAPEKTGYTFDGWYLDEAAAPSSFDTTITSDITLTAKWEINKYTVTFDSYGGTPVPPAQEVEYGHTATKPADPTLKGYTFAFWYLGEDEQNATAYDFNTPVTENITLTAKWNINKYTVTFNSYGGTPVPPVQEVEYGLTATKPADPTLKGYTFAFWYLGEDEQNATAYDFNTPVTENITLTAKWTQNTYTVTFDPNGGNELAEADKTKAVKIGEAYGELPTPTRKGYNFAGWYTEAEEGTVVTADTTVSAMTDHTLYAHWEAKKANVHIMIFKSNDLGTPIVDRAYTTDAVYGDTLDLAEIDPSSYLDFDFEIDGGWYDDGLFNLYKKYVSGEQANKPAALTKLQITGNWQNLKLIVTELVPVVYFKSAEALAEYQNDHSKVENIIFTTKARVGSTLPTADAPTATRDGYTFTFWSREGQIGTDVTGQTVNGWTNLVANWEARTDTPYTVEHYLENLDGSYALDTTEPLKGTTDTTVTAAAKSYDNFTYDSTVPGTVASGNIAADGSLVLKLFYTRNTYDYTVRHIKQLPDGSYDEANAEVETLSGKFEALAAVTAKDYGEHYPTNDADTKQNIKIEKGLTIDVKYNLDEHTLTFETNGGSAINPVTVRHGNAVARPADPTKDKYTFIGWYVDPEFTAKYDFATVLEADKTIYAKFELTSTPIGDIYVRYDVLHIKQLPDGTYDLANAEVEHLSAKKDTTVTAVIKDYRATHHVNVNRTLSKLTGTAIQPYMGVDGKPVYTILSVYYDLDFHTLTFDTMGGSKIAPETVRHGLTVAKPKDPVNGGYIFDGWYTDKTFRHRYDFSTPLTEDITIYAKWFLIVLPGVTVKKNTPKLNTADHFAYVQGYPDGTVKPAGNITRAETAAILFRLMDDASRKTYYSTKSGFRDVASGSWYNTYVATLNNAGVITDSSNGCFRPNEAITRAELAAMLAKFSETTGAANYFNDVSAKYWAANAIAICAKLGWINGYPDGTFRPDKNVTRAELMAMINRATGRAPKSADAFLPGMKTWIDNTSDKWYYLDVQEATNSHSYTVKGSETWTALTSDPNWSLYE